MTGTKAQGGLKTRIRHPRMYAVIYLNDHITTAKFVEDTLMEIFGKSSHEAKVLTQKVDKEGSAIAGVYSKDIAETKKDEVLQLAKMENFPFEVIVEPIEEDN